MSSFYVTLPGFENHSLGLPGKRSIKTGIFRGNRDGQRYVNARYGQSRLYLCVYLRGISFDQMKKIERKTLSRLIHCHGYIKQHGKKEHFIISNKKSDRVNFVKDVQNLYSRFVQRSRGVTSS